MWYQLVATMRAPACTWPLDSKVGARHIEVWTPQRCKGATATRGCLHVQTKQRWAIAGRTAAKKGRILRDSELLLCTLALVTTEKHGSGSKAFNCAAVLPLEPCDSSYRQVAMVFSHVLRP